MLTGGLIPQKQADIEAAVAAGDWSVVSETGGESEDEGASGSLLKEVHEVAAKLNVLLAVLRVAPMLTSHRDRSK